jgi:hypothetical protein
MIEKLRWAATKAISLLRTQAALDARLDEIQFTQGAILTQLALNRQGTRLSDFEFKVFSQWGEDGIIQKLIRHIDIPNKAFIEFGCRIFVSRTVASC